MPRLILKCPYLKGGSKSTSAHLENLVNYIATRDGVEKINIEIIYGGKVKCDKNGVGVGMPGYISKNSIYLLEVSNWIFRPLGSKT